MLIVQHKKEERKLWIENKWLSLECGSDIILCKIFLYENTSTFCGLSRIKKESD